MAAQVTAPYTFGEWCAMRLRLSFRKVGDRAYAVLLDKKAEVARVHCTGVPGVDDYPWEGHCGNEPIQPQETRRDAVGEVASIMCRVHKHTSAVRADLDESDTTARVCDGCGKWTVAGKPLSHIGECFTMCPDCCGGNK